MEKHWLVILVLAVGAFFLVRKKNADCKCAYPKRVERMTAQPEGTSGTQILRAKIPVPQFMAPLAGLPAAPPVERKFMVGGTVTFG